MLKIFIGLAAAAVIALGGFFGLEAYIQHRIAGEIETNFAQIRAAGGHASRGDVTFSLWHRTVTISDIAADFTARRPASVKIGRFTAAGVSLRSSANFTADSIVATDIEASGPMAFPAGTSITFKVPRLEVTEYSGPTEFKRQFDSSSSLDMYRFVLEQLATVRATSVAAPSLVMTMAGTITPASTEYTYSDITIRDIKDGKISAVTLGRVNFATTVSQAGSNETLTGEGADINTYDIDTTAMAAILDPAHINDNQSYRIVGRMTTGGYTIKSDKGLVIHIDSVSNGEVKAQPSHLKLTEWSALALMPGTPPDLKRIRELQEAMSGLYGGLRIDDAAVLGFRIETPAGLVKLAAMRFNLDHGKIGEFAIEGLDAKTPTGPLKIGRFAIKGFDVANMMRLASLYSSLGQRIPPDRLLGLLALIEGIEVKDFTAPYKDSTKLVSIENLNLTWGQFVGPIPTQVQLSLKMTGPIDDKDGQPFTMLRDAGLDDATISANLGLTWNEGERRLVLDPNAFEIGGLFAATARTSLGNVNRNLFSTNLQQAVVLATQIEAGALEITFRDLGLVDLAVAQVARKQNISKEMATQSIANEIRTKGQASGDADSASAQIASEVASFVEKPHSTLTIKLTPKGSVPMLPMVQLLKSNAAAALTLFQVEARSAQ